MKHAPTRPAGETRDAGAVERVSDRTLRNLGARIRAERNRLGLSLEALARLAGISKMTLHRIETGATSPSIVTLAELSFHLKKPVEALIREGDARVVLLRGPEQESLFDPGLGIRVVAPRGLVSDRIVITHAELGAGTVIETHTNDGFEWALLTEGSAVVGIGEKEYRMAAGDAIFFDAHAEHWIRVEEKMRYVALSLRDG
jgi:transcriptional regulator with XRE-family HTH domain